MIRFPKVSYNSPVILTFCLLSSLILFLSLLIHPEITLTFFATSGSFRPDSPLYYFRLFSHVLGHSSVGHLVSNMLIILFVGPLIEYRIGSKALLCMVCITAGVTGALHPVFTAGGALGASGIACMMVILATNVNARKGEIPLTFLLGSLLFFFDEFASMQYSQNVSHASHIVGAFCGAVFGAFVRTK